MSYLINPYLFGGAGGLGLYQELGRTKLTGASDDISVTFTAKPYLMVLCNYISGGTQIDGRLFFNGDGGSGGSTNYAWRLQRDGNVNASYGSTYGINTEEYYFNTAFQYYFINNFSDYEKLVTGGNCHDLQSGAASVAPTRCSTVGKWVTTGSQITTVATTNIDSGDYAAGSELVVLGYDPADTAGDSIWEELASVELTGNNSTIDSGTFTAKKYLWVEINSLGNGAINNRLRFNGSAATDYAWRILGNGGYDGTATSQTGLPIGNGNAVSPDNALDVMYIINQADQQKLCINWTATDEGLTASNAPQSNVVYGKWSNSSDSITQIELVNTGAGDFNTGSSMKVWGFN